MLSVCVSAKDLETAKSLFEEMNSVNVEQNVVSMNTIIDVYAECCNEENGVQYLKKCRELFEEMEAEGLKADEQTYSTLLKLCSRGRLTTDAMKILNDMRCNGIRPNVVSYNTVLDGISKDQNLSNQKILVRSSKIVSDMKKDRVQPNATTYNSLINIALRVRDLRLAVQLFKEMKGLKIDLTVITFGTMIKCYAKLGDSKDGEAYLKPCLNMLKECENVGMKMDVVGYISLLSACANASNLDHALRIWSKMISDGENPVVSKYNAMINVCVSAGNLDKAVSLFSEMKAEGVIPNSITYATMTKCYEKLGDPKEADGYLKPCLDLLEQCEQAGLTLEVEGYTSLLSVCTNVSNLDQALNIWDKIIADKVKLDVVVYTAMINACLSEGNEDKAFNFLDQMKKSGIKPNIVTFGCLMSNYEKKKDKAGAEKTLAEMKTYGVQPDKAFLRMLKTLGIK